MSLRAPSFSIALLPPLLAALLAIAHGPAAAVSGPANANVSPLPALQTFRFQQGVAPTATYTGAADIELREQATKTNVGSAHLLTVDGVDNARSRRHVLLRWDLRPLPGSCVTISSATITLRVTNASVDAYEFYSILVPWSEQEATWLQRSAAATWQSPGAVGEGDSATLAIATTLPSPSTGAAHYPLPASGVALLQAWKDGTQANYGVGLIVRNTFDDDGLSFAAKESLDPATRPALTITCRGY